MTLAIVMPWRPSPDRHGPRETTRLFYRTNFPDTPIFEVDTDHDEFNLGACRNRGVAEAQAAGHDLVVVTDADTIPPLDVLNEAIAAASKDWRLHYPFSQCIYSGYSAAPGRANGGVFVIRAAAWDEMGGQDERLSGWGGDDDQLVAAATCLLGEPIRHRGVAVAMWHPAYRDIGSERHRPNAELVQRYWAAVNDSQAMRELIAERSLTPSPRR